MAIDYCVALDCDPKRLFGNGDSIAGSADILERLKSKNRGAMIAQLATQDGKDPSEIKVELQVPDKNGNPAVKEVSLAELEAEAKPLDEQSAACLKCPVNYLAKPYGCFGAVNYPIPASAENWLLGRLQPSGTIGAHLCLKFMSELRVSGDSIRQMRRSGLFENPKTTKVTYIKRFLKSLSVSADQLLETIFMAGNAVAPAHCFNILLWLGAIKYDGKTPGSLDDQGMARQLLRLRSRADKELHASLELGPKPDSADAEVFQSLMKALYLSWLHDVPLLMSV